MNRAPIPAFHFLRRLAGALPVKMCEPLAKKKVQEKIPTRHYLWDVCSMINKVWPDITFHSEADFPFTTFHNQVPSHLIHLQEFQKWNLQLLGIPRHSKEVLRRQWGCGCQLLGAYDMKPSTH